MFLDVGNGDSTRIFLHTENMIAICYIAIENGPVEIVDLPI